MRRISAWVTGKSVRFVARLGAEAFTDYARTLLRAAGRSPRNAHALATLLSQVRVEQLEARRDDVAAAVAGVSVDICRPRGNVFELKLAGALS